MWKQGGMYLKAQGIIIGIVTLLCTGGLWLLGNPYFLLLGIVIGLTDALPFIGTGTLLIPIAVYLIFQRKYQLALGYGALFLVTYVAREFLEPKLVGGVNDSDKDARDLATLIGDINCHVNLIPVNPIKERSFVQPYREVIEAFKNKLEKNHINVTIRREMGRDIGGACGQLRKSYIDAKGRDAQE